MAPSTVAQEDFPMSKHKHKKHQHHDMTDPRIQENMNQQQDIPIDRKAEGSIDDVGNVDGPHLFGPSESNNRSQDEGKIYDL